MADQKHITPEQREEMRRLLAQGTPVKQVAKQFGVQPTTVSYHCAYVGAAAKSRQRQAIRQAVGDYSRSHPAATNQQIAEALGYSLYYVQLYRA